MPPEKNRTHCASNFTRGYFPASWRLYYGTRTTPSPLDSPERDLPMSDHSVSLPGIVVDGSGLLCVTLLIRLRSHIQDAAPGTVVHVISTDPAAPLDLPAWCHMTGHTYLGALSDESDGTRSLYALRTAAQPEPTRADAPWHRDSHR
ncbi:sulfurtransferase TusA family protein [Streptomyces klenkii]|uniref:sulfurtransferase TusA family protein n=1 Tax=Streptomyces klenkii TaxID=1420899 RepID=UPI00342E90CE